jgi:hypothetical protein
MKTVVAAFLLAFLPCAKPGTIIDDGEIEIIAAVNCGYKYKVEDDEGNEIEKEGEIVKGECEFEVGTRLRRTNLRRNMKSHSSDDEGTFVTFEDCHLTGDISGNDYTLVDAVRTYQESDFDGTIVRSMFDDVFLIDKLENVVAKGTKPTTVTIREDADGEEVVDSIDDPIDWEVVLCDSTKLSVGEQGYLYKSNP